MSVSVHPLTDTAPVTPSSGATRDLTLEDLHASLSELGHNRHGELVYTRCFLACKQLYRLSGLERYRNLQQLSLDNNALTDLNAVRHMPQLAYLSARHNKLNSDVFETLTASAGCLERLHLDDNCLTSLNGVERLPYLTDLSCAENRIAELPVHCLSSARRLVRLRLGRNRISHIDAHAFDAAQQLRVLELQENALTSVAFLQSVPSHVEQLVLASNHIAHLHPAIQHLTGTATLDLRNNRLAGLSELELLRPLVALHTLHFESNPDAAHLPHLSPLPPPQQQVNGDQQGQQAAAGRTEYHAEVVMSDEEGQGAHTASDEEREFEAADAMEQSDDLDVQSDTMHPGHSTATALYEADGTAADGTPYVMADAQSPREHRVLEKVYRDGGRYTTSSPLAAAAPTTAAYVALAAPETHGFMCTIGNAGRDAELSVRVHTTKEILALPESEQVYLWTLAIIPHLSELNGRCVSSDDVARARFLFSSPPK